MPTSAKAASEATSDPADDARRPAGVAGVHTAVLVAVDRAAAAVDPDDRAVSGGDPTPSPVWICR
jgi:hypothetical protein